MKKGLLLFFVCATQLLAAQQDPLNEILKSELQRNFEELKQESIPAYYMNYRVHDTDNYTITGSFGALTQSLGMQKRFFDIQVRVGSPALDNEGMANANMFWGSSGRRELVLDNNPAAIRRALWDTTDQNYKGAVQVYEKKKADMAVKAEVEDKAPYFSFEKAEKYYEKPIQRKEMKFDSKQWEEKIKKYSALFADNKDILEGTVTFNVELVRKYFVDSEGTEIAENSYAFRLSLQASTMAEDGMVLPLYQSYYAPSLKELPSDAEVMQDAKAICAMLSKLKTAPAAESYSGPAILSAKASGVFFHEIFGHRVEGGRLKNQNDAQTFKKKVGEQVLPTAFTLRFDPQLSYYKKHPLSGGYTFDDEGVRGQAVTVVEQGILRNFLMSRKPIDGFSHSNGHGRGMIYTMPVTRQSNLIVETDAPKSEEELRAMLLADIQASNQEYGYLFQEVSGGFTQTSRYSPNVFNVDPLVVYRVYADGRPDELVRGVSLIGTPLAMFSQITACGNDWAVFNGMCGAESGTIPVSCVSPSLYIKRIETQKKMNQANQPPLLERP